MRIWIIERDHQPMTDIRPFKDNQDDREKMKHFLNCISTEQDHYYDAVLYERVEVQEIPELPKSLGRGCIDTIEEFFKPSPLLEKIRWNE